MATLHDDVVPGTVHLVDIGGDMHTRHLDGNKEIVLVPKPSSDPEDPLNWTRKRKMLSIGMCYVYTIGVGISTAVQYSGTRHFQVIWSSRRTNNPASPHPYCRRHWNHSCSAKSGHRVDVLVPWLGLSTMATIGSRVWPPRGVCCVLIPLHLACAMVSIQHVERRVVRS